MNNSEKKPFFVLYIDSGGMAGIISLMILHEIEKQTQRPIAQLFDMVTGVSTGALIGLCLLLPKTTSISSEKKYSSQQSFRGNTSLSSNAVKKKDALCEKNIQISSVCTGLYPIATTYQTRFSAYDVWQMYKKYGSVIFQKSKIRTFFDQIPMFSTLLNFYSSPYAIKNLYDVCDAIFQENLLSCTIKPLVVPSIYMDQKACGLTTFHTYNTPNVHMRDVAVASAAVPFYFDPHKISTQKKNIFFMDAAPLIQTPWDFCQETIVHHADNRPIIMVTLHTLLHAHSTVLSAKKEILSKSALLKNIMALYKNIRHDNFYHDMRHVYKKFQWTAHSNISIPFDAYDIDTLCMLENIGHTTIRKYNTQIATLIFLFKHYGVI